MQLNKTFNKFIIVCLLIACLPLILVGMFIFVGHGFEPVIAALHLREMNRIEEPLTIGDTWVEKDFAFEITDITELSKRDIKDDVHIYSINFKLENQSAKISDYDVYVSAKDKNDELIKSSVPDNAPEIFEADKEYSLTFMTPMKTAYADIIVRIPYGKHRYYQNKYRLYIP